MIHFIEDPMLVKRKMKKEQDCSDVLKRSKKKRKKKKKVREEKGTFARISNYYSFKYVSYG